MCSHAREDFLKGSVTVVYLTIPMAEREAVEAKRAILAPRSGVVQE